MINFLKKHWLIVLILLFASFLRFYKLDSYPALNADEASIGYDAYSLIKTGMDQHGNAWPVHFQSFNDYKPGLYVYLVLPFVKFLGLSAWAVRIPNAVFGVLTVLLVYLLGNELFSDRKFEIWHLKFGIWPALMLAISPWHIQFSRGGWEVDVSTFLITFGVYLFVKFVNTKRFRYLIFSIFGFALSLYTYQAARIITPLLGIGLAAIYRKELFRKENIKIIFVSIFLFLILILPLARDLTKGNILSRAAGVGLFADPGPLNRINEQRGEHGNLNSILAKFMHNKGVNYGLAFLKNWADHYSGEFLFLTGDLIQRDKVPETGEMYLTDIIFILIGIVVLARNVTRKEFHPVFFWLLIAPTAAALTFQAPHALRSQNMVIPLVIISSLGFVEIIKWLDDRVDSKFLLTACYLLLAALITWNFARYEHMYWTHMSKEYPFSSQYGVSELAEYISQSQNKYKNIIVTDRYDQPYILFLFYLKYPPQNFQGRHNLTARDQFGFSTVRSFDKFRFEKINFDKMRTEFPNSLIIGTPEEIPKEANVVKKIYGSNGYEYFDVVAN